MRRTIFGLCAIMLLVSACRRTYLVTETTTFPVTTTLPTATSIPAPTETPAELPTVVSYGCQQTVAVFRTSLPYDFWCANQEIRFALRQGTLTTALFTTPSPVLAGQPVTVITYAKIESLFSNSLVGQCILTDSQTGTELSSTFYPTVNQVIHADCVVGEIKFTMAYTVSVIPANCSPEIIWESQTPGNFTLDAGKTYLIEVAFPYVTGDDAWWAHEVSWVEVTPSQTLTFVNAIGKVYAFPAACSQMDRQAWEMGNLFTSPNLLENFLHAGVVQ
ncbi:TPA: hypothetical protein DIU27_05235 [Candidatus Collierbacteria bacterium]|uniref:Uncharacterized protein n=1 Tax=Candidatus Collierbacteria bacterium GW2011_GWB2_44_22 TaxID=1618387 RepID=A0A0G1K4N3_9BACT|nr:MAG: hypothetical protein UW31_C0002G0018 [Candidatus Collierbacteria bacterium GW2011_GWA2_44_13]KKT51227.1 MAG: hypothetical protein UW44_C0014G0019 [Candidatus Collierbacteria bacterium GW2011_GWB2_44_22]KKT62186.1 MAG: hypothetical protein UW56_C0010G0018 [Candidatus Collierbacteria bacterium GW2011_GWD1_44_27]KKT65662.1 MAG: hypothetical protein UW58_C0023G0005 [Candidatus Collierbacteria bacterium GW2011_GWC2_44_30]KKT68805.1 MAG: hypothetical protein UW64_C0009G0017 [Microgenomates gr